MADETDAIRERHERELAALPPGAGRGEYTEAIATLLTENERLEAEVETLKSAPRRDALRAGYEGGLP
ncbi:unnamed protein product [marine sediment metagenome]|uniref:Uncharacterized protein n=1 Tax=marine sediment metagenome TaxID=412755 RepID=X0XUR5_9ZZZZ